MKTKLLKVGLPVFVALASAFVIFPWVARPSSDQQKLAESIKQDEAVLEQYFTADYDTAKDAMLNHIRHLDLLSAEAADSIRNPYAADAKSWYVRLAKLEERNGGNEKSEYMKEACSRCDKLGGADCSEGKLRLEVDRLDIIALSQMRK